MLTYDEKLGRSLKWTFFGVIAFLVLFVLWDNASAKDLPEIVPISKLSSTWDYKRVAIFGHARFCEQLPGRLRSNFIKCLVVSESGKVFVYSTSKLYGINGERVIVQGIYREQGKFGGLLADHFIVADALIRDWDK